MRTAVLLAAILLLDVSSHAQTRPSAPDLPPALARVLTDYEKAWRAKDAKALAQLFVEGRVVVPNACPPANSRAEVEKCYSGSGGDLSLRALAHGMDGSLGYIIGEFAQKEGAPPSGKFVLTLWKDSDGRWLILADMDRGYRRAP